MPGLVPGNLGSDPQRDKNATQINGGLPPLLEEKVNVLEHHGILDAAQLDLLAMHDDSVHRRGHGVV